MRGRGWEYTGVDARQLGLFKTFFLYNILLVAAITPRNVWGITEFFESFLFPVVA